MFDRNHIFFWFFTPQQRFYRARQGIAQAYVREQPVAHLDETGWREGRARAWLWVAVTAWVTVFAVRLSRGAKVVQALLGERFCGILVTDRWSAYNWYPTRWRQVCWAHLLRDFEAMIERGGHAAEIGEALQQQARLMFHEWHRVRDGTLPHAQFRVLMRPIRRQVAQKQLWDPERRRVAVCRSHDDSGGNAQAAAPQRPRVYDGCVPGSIRWSACPIPPASLHRDPGGSSCRSIACSTWTVTFPF